MLLVQKWPFCQLFLLGNIDQENVFYDSVERKNAFLGYKNKKLKKSQNWDFPRGFNPGFGQKMTRLAFWTSFFYNLKRRFVFILSLKWSDGNIANFWPITMD